MNTPDRSLHPVNLPREWTPTSWRERPALQLPQYPDAGELASALQELRGLPPLVTSWEILALKQQLAEAQEGKRFLLQGGDCAENFAECSSEVISNRLKVLLQMSLVLVHGLRKPVVRVGRFAGQYAKPRSTDTETVGRRDPAELPRRHGQRAGVHRGARTPRSAPHDQGACALGDDDEFRARADRWRFRRPAPPRVLEPQLGRSFAAGRRVPAMVNAIGDAVRFMETLSGAEVHNLNRVDFYTSHEALLLPYEESMTRQVPRHWGWFNLSTHFPWIGMRTAAIDGAHVEYFRGIRNPIAVKVGPSVTPEQLLRVIDVLNPDDDPGRLTFIHRMGAAHIAAKLPALLDAVRRDGRRVLWICDPMHGNTEATSNGYKTRRFSNIGSELEQAFDAHAAAGTRLGGVHLELTGEDVTECLGGARELTETDLERAYTTMVDPRLNYEQALEVAMLIVRKQAQIAKPA